MFEKVELVFLHKKNKVYLIWLHKSIEIVQIGLKAKHEPAKQEISIKNCIFIG